MPVFTVKIPKEKLGDSKYVKASVGAILPSGSAYLYILDANEYRFIRPSKTTKVNNRCINTDLYKWADVHSLENLGCEDDSDDEVQERYTKDWTYILADNYTDVIQSLIPKIEPKSIIVKKKI